MTTWYVSPSGNDSTGDGSYSTPWEHIYKAIDESISGDTILLLDGTYAEEVSRTFNKSLKIQSESEDYTKVIIELHSIASRLWKLSGSGKILKLYDLSIINEEAACWIFEPSTSSNTLEVVRCFVLDKYGYLGGFKVGNTNSYIYKSTFRGLGTASGDDVIVSSTTSNTIDTKDCIFEGNFSCFGGYYNDILVSQGGNYNCFYNNTYDWGLGDSNYGVNDITSNPKFVNTTSADLQNISPCIDAGVIIPGYVETYAGTAPDMGVFEYAAHIVTGTSIITLTSSYSENHNYLVTGNSIIRLIASELNKAVQKVTGTSIIELSSSELHFHVQKLLANYSIYSDIRLLVNNITLFSVGSDIRLSELTKISIGSDIRFNISEYEKLEPKKVTDFIIKLDGITLTDVDVESANIGFNLGTSPSEVRFTLIRRHDNYDYTLDGIYSQISNENKIQIYDDTKLLFTGYISTINADSQRDVVDIIAQDIRYKLNKLSIQYTITPRTVIEVQDIIGSHVKPSIQELPEEPSSTDALYYGYYNIEEKTDILYQGYNIFLNNGEILKYILDKLVSDGLIVGYESTILDYVNVQLEGKNIANSYAEMIDTIIKECVTLDWYIDENEVLRYVVRNVGDIKTLNLASINKRRHIYDVIIDDIVLNREQSTYTKGLLIKFGKHHRSLYWTSGLTDIFFNPFYYSIFSTHKEKTYFSFQYSPLNFLDTPLHYIGEGATNYSYYSQGIMIASLYIFQVKTIEEYDYIPDVIIGDATAIKVIQMDSYGRETTSSYYQEKTDEDGNYLYLIQPENNDLIDYAIDNAKLELNQNNKLLSTATVTLLLDAYEYYNISFKNLINIDNTIEEGIYKNNNQFPLNIEKISLNLGNRIITLSLTNYNGSFYKRTTNYEKGIMNIHKEYRKYKLVSSIQVSQGL